MWFIKIHRTAAILAVASITILQACSSYYPRYRAGDDPYFISRTTIEYYMRQPSVFTAYDLITRYYPQLRAKSLRYKNLSSNSVESEVYLSNGIRVGPLQWLQSYHLEGIESIRFIPANEALIKFGSHGGAGIFVLDLYLGR